MILNSLVVHQQLTKAVRKSIAESPETSIQSHGQDLAFSKGSLQNILTTDFHLKNNPKVSECLLWIEWKSVYYLKRKPLKYIWRNLLELSMEPYFIIAN